MSNRVFRFQGFVVSEERFWEIVKLNDLGKIDAELDKISKGVVTNG